MLPYESWRNQMYHWWFSRHPSLIITQVKNKIAYRSIYWVKKLRQALMHSKRKIPNSWRTGRKAKACTSLALYLKVFKSYLYYLRHVRVLSIKPCSHTQLPENNRSYWKVSRGWGHLITWNGWGIWTAFWPREEGIWTKISKNSNSRGVVRGGMLKLRFDWYIINK